MDWIRGNWYWLLFGGLFIWMHFRMHGAHARHGGMGCCGGHAAGDPEEEQDHRAWAASGSPTGSANL